MCLHSWDLGVLQKAPHDLVFSALVQVTIYQDISWVLSLSLFFRDFTEVYVWEKEAEVLSYDKYWYRDAPSVCKEFCK